MFPTGTGFGGRLQNADEEVGEDKNNVTNSTHKEDDPMPDSRIITEGGDDFVTTSMPSPGVPCSSKNLLYGDKRPAFLTAKYMLRTNHQIATTTMKLRDKSRNQKERPDSGLSQASSDSDDNAEGTNATTERPHSARSEASLDSTTDIGSSSSEFREVPFEDYEIGYDHSGIHGKRVIVKEAVNKNMGREYRSYGKQLYVSKMSCLGCTVKAMWHNRKLYVPREHQCFPKTMESIEAKQQLNKRKRYGKNCGKFSSNVKRAKKSCPPSDFFDSRDDGHSNNSSSAYAAHRPPTPFIRACSIPAEVATGSTNGNRKSVTSGSDIPVVIFCHAAPSFLKQCCQKFGLPYHGATVLKFWSKIDIEEIAGNDIPDQIYTSRNSDINGFFALSLFFSGEEIHGYSIEKKLSGLVVENFKEIERNLRDAHLTAHDLVECMESSNPHPLHFEVICLLFKIKIGVYVDGDWKRYGTWTPNEMPTFLFAFENEKYCPVLTLKN